MSRVLTIVRIRLVGLLLILPTLMVASCGTRHGRERPESLDLAIAAFIAGDYEVAIGRLEPLTADDQSEDVRQEAYLFMGRAYLAQGRFDRAIDAFVAGKAHGGGSVFDAYLARLDVLVSSSPERLERTDWVTRAQLAALVDRLVYSGGDDVLTAPGAAFDSTAAIPALQSIRRGVVGPLPDGTFRPEAPVTRGAFYAAVCRLLRELEITSPPSTFLEGGFRWAMEGAEPRYVTGEEAISVLERIVEARTQTRAGSGSSEKVDG